MSKKIMVVDDSALMRRVLSDIIDLDQRFVMEDSAKNGLEAFDMIVTNPDKYDLIILDINMPKMNGIQMMEMLNSKNIKIPILIVSTIAKEGATETLKCLELGAFDFITKPESFMETKSAAFKTKILSFMCAAMKLNMAPISDKDISDSGSGETRVAATKPSVGAEDKKESMASRRTSEGSSSTVRTPIHFGTLTKAVPEEDKNDGPMSYTLNTTYHRKNHVPVSDSAKKLVAIASSTGGPKSLQSVIPKLPKNLNAPIVLVQHMPEGFTGTLAQRLNDMSEMTVKEAEDGIALEKGTVYIAKGGKQLKIVKNGGRYCFQLTDEPPRSSLRPCADIMYESLKTLDFDEVTCVVLTGMGSDGTRGIGQLSEVKNVYVIAQDEATSTVYGMPRMVKEAGLTDEVVKLDSIADAITKNVGLF